MNPKNLWPIIVLCTLCPLASRAAEQNETVPREYQGFAEVTKYRGVIDDPDGYVNLRKEPQPDAPVVTKVKAGEPFSFQRKENETWCEVKLSSCDRLMHYSRTLYFTKDDLPGKPEKGDEIDQQASKQGINYTKSPRSARRQESA
jgi:uncharacterized protein YgiM (DUF1202 family)